MQLSEKKKAFSELFFAYSKCTLDFEHFPEKDEPRS